MPILIMCGLLLTSAAVTTVVRWRRNPSAYAIIGGTFHDRRAISIGIVVAAVVLALNVLGGEGVAWTLFPAAFIGFVVASIIHHARTRRVL